MAKYITNIVPDRKFRCKNCDSRDLFLTSIHVWFDPRNIKNIDTLETFKEDTGSVGNYNSTTFYYNETRRENRVADITVYFACNTCHQTTGCYFTQESTERPGQAVRLLPQKRVTKGD